MHPLRDSLFISETSIICPLLLEVVNLDVTDLLDYYYAGNGIAFNAEDRKFSIDLKEGEKFLVVDASGLGNEHI